jgi:nucleoid-associated protein YgaU
VRAGRRWFGRGRPSAAGNRLGDGSAPSTRPPLQTSAAATTTAASSRATAVTAAASRAAAAASAAAAEPEVAEPAAKRARVEVVESTSGSAVAVLLRARSHGHSAAPLSQFGTLRIYYQMHYGDNRWLCFRSGGGAGQPQVQLAEGGRIRCVSI